MVHYSHIGTGVVGVGPPLGTVGDALVDEDGFSQIFVEDFSTWYTLAGAYVSQITEDFDDGSVDAAFNQVTTGNGAIVADAGAPSQPNEFECTGNSGADKFDYTTGTITDGRVQCAARMEVDTDTFDSSFLYFRFRVQSPFGNNDGYEVVVNDVANSIVDEITLTIKRSGSVIYVHGPVEMPAGADITAYDLWKVTCEDVSGGGVAFVVEFDGTVLATFIDEDGSEITAAGRTGWGIESSTGDGSTAVDDIDILSAD